MIDVDGHHYPNLALMKLSAWHKRRGDQVEWYAGFDRYDKVYMAKVFGFTPDYNEAINAESVERGGTGYDIRTSLPDEADRMHPDYTLYPAIARDTAYGFLTRGCPNRCKWCIVPKKKGIIRPYMDVDEIAAGGRTNLVLMDNNVLASDYGLEQLEKIARKGYRVDFNQGLDARIVSEEIAALLAKVRWAKRIRFGCDTPAQVEECERAIEKIRRHGYKGEFLLYCILMEFKESFARVNHWKGRHKIYPYCQPFRDLDNPGRRIPQWQKDLARWADRKALFTTCEFKDFEPRKGFKCNEYFIKTTNE